jgi:uncharacterized protein
MEDLEIQFADDVLALDDDIELEADDTLAFDRRTIDVDGRMHVPDCNISKSNVCVYLGREIPDYVRLGLDANGEYRLYRDPAALAAAASTFENLPLMMTHVEVSAANPQKMLTVGAVSNVRWKAPYLVADLAVWDAEAIAAVQNESQRELSCGYRYKAIMAAGKINGEAFDGRMVDIRGNHVALVAAGRVGSDVIVRDEALGVPMHVAFPNWNRLNR